MFLYTFRSKVALPQHVNPIQCTHTGSVKSCIEILLLSLEIPQMLCLRGTSTFTLYFAFGEILVAILEGLLKRWFCPMRKLPFCLINSFVCITSPISKVDVMCVDLLGAEKASERRSETYFYSFTGSFKGWGTYCFKVQWGKELCSEDIHLSACIL